MIWDSGQGGMSQVRRQGGTDSVQGGIDSVQGGAHAQLSGHSYGATATAAACVRERERRMPADGRSSTPRDSAGWL